MYFCLLSGQTSIVFCQPYGQTSIYLCSSRSDNDGLESKLGQTPSDSVHFGRTPNDLSILVKQQVTFVNLVVKHQCTFVQLDQTLMDFGQPWSNTKCFVHLSKMPTLSTKMYVTFYFCRTCMTVV